MMMPSVLWDLTLSPSLSALLLTLFFLFCLAVWFFRHAQGQPKEKLCPQSGEEVLWSETQKGICNYSYLRI